MLPEIRAILYFRTGVRHPEPNLSVYERLYTRSTSHSYGERS